MADRARSIAQAAEQHLDAFNVIERGVEVAVGNLESHVRALEQHFGQAREWSDREVRQQDASLRDLERILINSRSLPANGRFYDLLPLLHGDEQQDQQTREQQTASKDLSLDCFINRSLVKDAVAAVRVGVRSFSEDLKNLGTSVDGVLSNANTLFDAVQKTHSRSAANIERDLAQLIEEVDVVANKIASDSEHVLSLSPGPKSVSLASRMALHHTKNLLPSLREYSLEMNELLYQSIDQRNTSAQDAVAHMQEVASNEAAFAHVDSLVKKLDFSTENPEAFDVIALLTQLPFIYGALLVEAVRRREWAEKIRSESASLAEDIAGYREEEERRRKRWVKNFDNFIHEEAANGRALNFELSLQAEESRWPEISREDVELYLQALRSLKGFGDVLEELEASFKDIDRPTKRQARSAKNFKSGSVHDVKSGKSSFLLRDAEEMKALKETNVKLEDEVKGQKSRVRKLEDLLYKQSQAGRSASGNIFQSSSPPPLFEHPASGRLSPSNTNQSLIHRRTSNTSRRSSATKSGEEKTFVRRIVDLEGQLASERQKRESVEAAVGDAHANHARAQAELEESRSTKKDLMANLDAQQREFASERRLLEDNMKNFKNRAEEAEEELDRVLGSRDTEKLNVEGKVRAFEHQLEIGKQQIAKLEADNKSRNETQEEQNHTLRNIHHCLDPGTGIPTSTAELVNNLDGLAERTRRHVQDISQAVSAARSEKQEVETLLDRKQQELVETRTRCHSVEEEVSTLKNEISAERAKANSLAEELEDGRQQLRSLRAKFAEGETGSDSLRQRVEQQAARASSLSTELAESKSHVNSLDVELSSLQRKHHQLLSSHNVITSLLERRTSRAKELTSRLVAYHQELARLLEALGLSTTRRDGKMVVQRSSKLASQSATLTETSFTTAGSPLLPAGMQPFDTSIDSSLVAWTNAETPEDEAERVSKLLVKVDDFNLTTFSEAVIKLRRDVEWTGKKWKMEARNYRDKYHRCQTDAHEKLAFRSFKEGDLALFLPTRNQATRPWAAFNVGAPHYFLREQDSHRLQNREWLVARILKVEERMVDLSKAMGDSLKGDRRSVGETSDGGASAEDDNPFELSDGLRWYLLDAVEEKTGAPTTPGLGKSTVASAHVDAKGSIRMKKLAAGDDASGKLNKSLESRRSSSNSKRGSVSGAATNKDGAVEAGLGLTGNEAGPGSPVHNGSEAGPRPTSRSSNAASGPTLGVPGMTIRGNNAAIATDEVRKDQLFGP